VDEWLRLSARSRSLLGNSIIHYGVAQVGI
jgi:hypothetical protein